MEQVPAAKRVCRADDEDDEVVIVEPPTARDGEDLEEQRLRVRKRRLMELDEMIAKREAELRILKALRASLDL